MGKHNVFRFIFIELLHTHRFLLKFEFSVDIKILLRQFVAHLLKSILLRMKIEYGNYK